MFTAAQTNRIKTLLASKEWQEVEQVAHEVQAQIRSTSPLRNTQWETTKETLLREGKIQGINTLIQELYALSQNND